MNTEIKAVHFTLHDDAKEYLNKKLERIHNAENMIVDLLVSIKKEKDFEAEAFPLGRFNPRQGNRLRADPRYR